MFNPGLGAIPSAAKQRETVKGIIFDTISNGTFTYTELLAAEEPWRTMALEALDGVTVTGSKPSYDGSAAADWDGQPFRLIHVNPNGRIRVPVTKKVRIPGSTVTKDERLWDDVGNIADVYDHPHNRQARQLLHTRGWPIRQTISKGNAMGEIVEWAWILQEVQRGDQARPGVIELYTELAARMEAWEAAKDAAVVAKAAAKKNTKNESRGAQAAT